jgi:hypothetical protein
MRSAEFAETCDIDKHRQRNFLEELRGGRGREILLELENLDSNRELTPPAI